MTIKFVRDIDGDYGAVESGIKFKIYNSTQGFGITAYRISDGKKLHEATFIFWCGTKKRCVEYAEKFFWSLGHEIYKIF